jgi:hypothetical protein
MTDLYITDLYIVGVILFSIFAGQTAFCGHGAADETSSRRLFRPRTSYRSKLGFFVFKHARVQPMRLSRAGALRDNALETQTAGVAEDGASMPVSASLIWMPSRIALVFRESSRQALPSLLQSFRAHVCPSTSITS